MSIKERLEDTILIETLTQQCLKEFCPNQDYDPIFAPWGGYFSKPRDIIAVNTKAEA